MWNTNTIWLEIAIVTIVILLGHIFLGHFEERGPKWRKLARYVTALLIVSLTSVYFGRTAAFVLFSLSLVPVLNIHVFLLPKKGINGWTGEPKSKYYDFWGWNKDIFNEDKNKKEETEQT